MIRNLITALVAAFALQAFAAVDVNRANRSELESVKGIGPGLSAKILQAREKAEFKNWDDLVERVGGVGPGNARRFSQAGLTVAGAPYEASASARAGADAKPAKAAGGAKATQGEKADKNDKTAKPRTFGTAAKP